MLIDKYLPVYDVRDYHRVRVAADADRTYAALRSLDIMSSPVIRALFTVRNLPARLRSEKWKDELVPNVPFLETALGLGWVILEENPGRELVVGAVTQPWAADVRFHGLPGPELIAFSEPGHTKIVWNMAVEEQGPGVTAASIETRVAATDEESRRRFRRYWFLVNPGIRLIRFIALRLLKRRLEASSD